MEDFYLKEDVLDIEIKQIFDAWHAWRVRKQNTDVLPYGSYIDDKNKIIVDEDISRMSSKDFGIINNYFLFLKTDEKDDYFGIVHIDSLDKLLRKIEEINELYGIKKRRKPLNGETFYYIIISNEGYPECCKEIYTDTELDNDYYINNNCFLNKEECLKKIEKIKSIMKE